MLFFLFVLYFFMAISTDATINEPGFSGPIANVTAPLGREAVLACTVHNLSTYKVERPPPKMAWSIDRIANYKDSSSSSRILILFSAGAAFSPTPGTYKVTYGPSFGQYYVSWVAWLRVDTQTILTIHTHMISRSRRVGVTHSDHRTWFLHIRELRETDKGWYMCQINTDPMKSQTAFLDIVVPPDILDHGTSPDQTVQEGSSVTLTCKVTGSPHPQISWRREHSEIIAISDDNQVTYVEGPTLKINRVERQHAGAYLCIASNGIPPTVSKRIIVTVAFAPVVTLRNQLVGAILGSNIVLECETQALPKPINYWKTENGAIIPAEGMGSQKTDLTILRLSIRNVSNSDYGTYKCVSKNSLGDTEASIKVYPVQKFDTAADLSSDSTSIENQDFRLLDPNKANTNIFKQNHFYLSFLAISLNIATLYL